MFIVEKQKRSNNLYFQIKGLVMSVFLILARNPNVMVTDTDYPVLFIKQAQDKYNLLLMRIKRL